MSSVRSTATPASTFPTVRETSMLGSESVGARVSKAAAAAAAREKAAKDIMNGATQG